MNEKTKQLTTGAMLTAIFAAMLLINRQTAGFFEEMILFLLPIPMTAFSSRYGFRASIAVFFSMTLISVLVSTPTAIFYAVTEAIIGMVLGTGVYHKRDLNRVLFEVMGCSAVANVLSTIVLANLFGYNISDEIDEMRRMMTEALSSATAGADAATLSALEGMLTTEFLFKTMVISMVLLGLIQGVVVFELSLLILRRLRFTVPKPKSLFLVVPPRWTAILAAVLFLTYQFSMGVSIREDVANILQTAGLCGYLYLLVFGVLGVILFVRKKVPRGGLLGGIAAFFLMFTMPMVEIVIGYCYMIPMVHDWLIQGVFPEETK